MSQAVMGNESQLRTTHDPGSDGQHRKGWTNDGKKHKRNDGQHRGQAVVN